MPRVKRGVHHAKSRRNLLRQAKGFKWGRKSKIKLAKTAVTKAGVYAYRDRRNKKRDFRALWQIKLNAALRPQGFSYSKFIDALKKHQIELDRKVLSELAVKEPKIFAAIVKSLK
ncbi:MAG: 50S ribosomal protein L20 [Candidatus Buchananbacteria bacterium]